MSANIREMYRRAGRTPPNPGKGIHTEKFHEVATSIMKENPSYSKDRAYAIAMGTLGRNRSVKKNHWGKG